MTLHVVQASRVVMLVQDGALHVILDGASYSFIGAELSLVHVNPVLTCVVCKKPCTHTRMAAGWLYRAANLGVLHGQA